MNEKFDALLKKGEDLVEKWADELITNPIRTGIKILVLIWIWKQAKKLLRDIR